MMNHINKLRFESYVHRKGKNNQTAVSNFNRRFPFVKWKYGGSIKVALF